MHHDRGVELNVRVQFAPRIKFLQYSDARLLDVLRELKEVLIGGVAGDRPQDLRSWIGGSVNSVSEPHQSPTLLDLLSQP